MVEPQAISIATILSLFAEKGGIQYDGEPVTQLEHALQSAYYAEKAHSSPALITAALLHDVGHLMHDEEGTLTQRGLDDQHQNRCLPALQHLFPPATLEPIRLHVDAKRYLCARDPEYMESLSADSRRSLALQGGPFSDAQAEEFLRQPFALDALRLRSWDDQAKKADMRVPDLAHYAAYMETARGAFSPTPTQYESME